MYLRDLVNVFKALGDETRLRLLKLLDQREDLCVCEMMQALNITQTRASRNLGILRNAGLVKDKREGLWVHYSLNLQGAPEPIRELLELIKGILNDDPIITSDKSALGKTSKLTKSRKH